MALRDFALDRRSLLAGIGAASLAGCATVPRGGADRFVRRDGMRFTRGGTPYRYAGANAWYLAWLGSDTTYGDRARLGRELDRLRRSGLPTFACSPGPRKGRSATASNPASRPGTELNNTLLAGLDAAWPSWASAG